MFYLKAKSLNLKIYFSISNFSDFLCFFSKLINCSKIWNLKMYNLNIPINEETAEEQTCLISYYWWHLEIQNKENNDRIILLNDTSRYYISVLLRPGPARMRSGFPVNFEFWKSSSIPFWKWNPWRIEDTSYPDLM